LPTGRNVAYPGQPAEYKYDVNLDVDFQLFALHSYWIEIAQIGLQNSLLRWLASNHNPNGYAVINEGVLNWGPVTGAVSLALQLYDVPEPSSYLMFLMFGWPVFTGRRRKK
jgi:hypothetical protein